MEKFETLQPTRLYVPDVKTGGLRKATVAPAQFVGRLPIDLHILVLIYLPIPDFPAYARCSRSLSNLARHEKVWEARWNALQFAKYAHFKTLLDQLEDAKKVKDGGLMKDIPPTLAVGDVDDDFGDFAQAQAPTTAGFMAVEPDKGQAYASVTSMRPPTSLELYRRAHSLLKPYTTSLSSPPHAILASLFPSVPGVAPIPLLQQSRILHLLLRWLSPRIQPLRKWTDFNASLRSAVDRYEANLLSAFDIAESRRDEKGMTEAAEASWEVFDGAGEWELSRVWAEKRGIFYEAAKWNPMDNVTQQSQLAFDAMDEFMKYVLQAFTENGSIAVRVFPSESPTLLSFASKLATDVIAEYINPLLSRAREISNDSFLRATAACFKESWKLVDAVIQVSSSSPSKSTISRTQAEDVIYRMFEENMDEYLDEEIESLRNALELICRGWDKKISDHAGASTDHARFLSSHNPAQVKRNVLASFTDVLLLPVTIVPKTVGAVGAAAGAAGSAAVQGLQMLSPQRWAGNNATPTSSGYSQKFDAGDMLFEIGGDEDEDDEPPLTPGRRSLGKTRESATEQPSNTPLQSAGSTMTSHWEALDVLLSLDVALELIHADRESLKRVDAFSAYPGHYGHKVQDTIEEVFILMLQAIAERHLKPGFERAVERLQTFKPDEHQESGRRVAPLAQFFELVHIGDTIQSMVQVYFDKELAPHIDKTDFLNGVVREKKRFENVLDESVAAGLNAGTDVLMNQVEHIIIKKTQPREYYPPEDQALDLGVTVGCSESIKCLELHCKLVKGSTSREVLEVFYQEVGIRLIAILQKHIKRQIISLNGGFKLIADLNAYHTFISGLKVQSITMDFSHLKMLGHVFVVDDAKDLAQIVRDATRYGGSYRPEDVYEFIQRRSDWKKIEKTVDKTMYNLSFKEDCVVC